MSASVSELSAIGRHLSQLARAANTGNAGAVARADLEALMRVCEGLRVHVKELLKANLRSWAVGHAED